MDIQAERQTDTQTDRWMDGWTDEYSYRKDPSAIA
jgi:hypothetical protein